MMSLHHPRCEHYTPPPADPRFARFGEAVWKYITKSLSGFFGVEISEDILPLAQAAGLCCRVEYDPELHGEEIDAEPGDEIWWWGDSWTNAKGEAQPPATLAKTMTTDKSAEDGRMTEELSSDLPSKLWEPFDGPDAANDALAAFYEDVRVARLKHRIADCTVVCAVNVRYEDGEGVAMAHTHNGDQIKAESLLAYAFGKEQAWRREYIARLASGKMP